MTVAAQAKEKKVKQEDLPSAVQRTFESQTQSAGATVSGYTKDTVDGEMFYRASVVVDGKTRTITAHSDGTLTSVEDEVAWEAVPVDVQTAMTRAAGKGKLSGYRSVTTDGKIVSYNALLETNGNRDRISVKPHAAALEAIPSAPPASEKK
jgi:hypothetical protein